MARPSLADAARVVIKIGSALLVDSDTGRLNRSWLESLADEIVRLRERGQQVLVVSSGAIALGRRYLGMSQDQSRLEDHQAAAAAGQILLAHAYQDLLDERGVRIAQVLLTLDDTEDRRRYLNARSTLATLLRLGVVPVINENDTVATQEIRYGDNDRLGARVAEMVSADCLVLLSDVDGFYTADPTTHADAALIPEVRDITTDIERRAGASNTAFGSGGMVTKLAAARICMAAGCATLIANGHRMEPLRAIEAGEPCTWFIPKKSPRAARKQWIAGSLTLRGRLVIDAGAERALAGGGSLLPVGVVRVEGEFERGDAIAVVDTSGRGIARGLAAYSSRDAEVIQGRRSDEIESLLGYGGRDEIIHRDDLVLMDG
ncbi:MAG: glutamate 5-kinase [Gammaproteobacteria bacterium]|nr:glutamate 5-kinase [Gammaproteobacteria bacterium]NND36875.1 glutamate 5-kinase [Gammaproteobacteria bacterium]